MRVILTEDDADRLLDMLKEQDDWLHSESGAGEFEVAAESFELRSLIDRIKSAREASRKRRELAIRQRISQAEKPLR